MVSRKVILRCPSCNGKGVVEEWNGIYLRDTRTKYRLSLRAVAAKVGISFAYLYDIEQRRRKCSEIRFGEIERAIHALKGPSAALLSPPVAPKERL